MATKNDITGDMLISRLPSEAYKNNYDLIFRRKGNPEKEKENGSTIEHTTPGHGESQNTSQSVD
jgi:hypothetical protein